MRAGTLNTGHRTSKVSAAALCIVDKFGAIEACAEGDIVLMQEPAQIVGEQPQIALHAKVHPAGRQAIAQERQRHTIELYARRQWLAPVKGDLQGAVFAEGSLPAHDSLECFSTHPSCALMRAEAVFAARGTGQRGGDHQVC